jgi:Ca2+-binding RTX toxin-like protein
MLGGDGNDYYYVRDSGDVVSETNATASTGGTDTVYSYVSSYTLGANVENGRIVASGRQPQRQQPQQLLYAGAGNNVIDGGAAATPSPTTTASAARPASSSALPRPPRKPPAARAPTP